MLGQLFFFSLFEGLRGVVGILTSTAQHRGTWSGQQDVVNVTSSVGTRGSSTVHSDSSQEEKKKKKSIAPEDFLLKPRSILQVPLGDLQKSDSAQRHKQICWEQWQITSLNVSLTYRKTAAKEFEHKEMWGVFGAQCDRKPNGTIRMRSKHLQSQLRVFKTMDNIKGVLHYNRNPQKTTHTRSVLYGYT